MREECCSFFCHGNLGEESYWVRVTVGASRRKGVGSSLLSSRKPSVRPARKADAGCRVGSIRHGVSSVSAANCPLPALTPLFPAPSRAAADHYLTTHPSLPPSLTPASLLVPPPSV
ncbi:hypothetical protein E2C01_052862 [Portunus trituberculatus]|uniref:Uncharacterized protein n=1 Tax=Portunus trituberculatus TaxID=210409 RepID=A0A5B7GIT8_PORTR|nr:hypothetical protein [Portunus trituberculatus]